MTSKLTYSPEAQCHQSALKTSTSDVIKLMKDKDKHNVKHYGSYIANIKFLLDTHIADLATHEPKDVEKQIIEMVKDLTCKYLHPQESETKSSDEDFPESFTIPVEEQIFSEFPEGALTDEMKTHIKNAIEFMEQLYTAAANALKGAQEDHPLSSLMVHSDSCRTGPVLTVSLNSEVTASGKSREKHLKVTPSCACY